MKKFLFTLILILTLALPWVIPTVYVNFAGIVVPGKVVSKQEAIVMPGGDSWRHTFEVTYEYRPLDSPYVETTRHRVDATLYRSLRIGSAVQIRYSPSHFVRVMEGVGSLIIGSSPFSRLPYGPPAARDIAEITGIALAALVGFVAYRARSKSLGLIGVVIAGTSAPVILLATSGLILLPIFFWAWRRSQGKSYGWALLGTIALCAAVVYWRVPRPTPMPPGPLRNSTATVRQVREVDEIWVKVAEGHPSAGGQDIRHPFQMVDLEFTPVGATEPIHFLDRLDLNSVPGLREGVAVPIQYSSSDPNLARIIGGTRNYAHQGMTYLLLFTYGAAGVVAFVFFPVAHGIAKLFRSSPVLRGITDPSVAMARRSEINKWSRLPEDDPRRKWLEAFLRARQSPRRPDTQSPSGATQDSMTQQIRGSE